MLMIFRFGCFNVLGSASNESIGPQRLLSCLVPQPIRLKTKDLDRKVKVFTLRPNYQYWPTLEIRYLWDERRWQMTTHSAPSAEAK
jgi:hypothetical protein